MVSKTVLQNRDTRMKRFTKKRKGILTTVLEGCYKKTALGT